MRNLGANNKKLKGNKKKVVVGMKDMLRNLMGIIMEQLGKITTVNAKQGIQIYDEKSINAILSALKRRENPTLLILLVLNNP